MPWDPPAPRLRDTVRAIRAVWTAWRSGERLDYRGEFHTLTLMTPFFTPPLHDYPIPIATAGVNPIMCRVAGEVADAFQVHPLHTPSYLKEVIIPAIRRGERRGGRGRTVTINASAFALIGTSQAELDAARAEARRTVAFYASTPSYRPVLTHHGWEDVGSRLSAIAARGEWQKMGEAVPDEMLDTIAVSGSPDDVGKLLRDRYRDVADRVGVYLPFRPEAAAWWTSLIAAARD
jgi:probable F420-dependent oxidoreductase